jgi:Zn-dependent protease/CBS domain-containing protein
MLRLGSVRGVPILVAPSWLLIALLVSIIYGPLVKNAVPGVTSTVAYLSSLGFAALFALCILAHELAHTLVSISLGHPVRRVVLFMLGGVSEIEKEPERAGLEFLIAAAGPLVSLALGAGAWGLSLVFAAHSVFAVLCELLAWSNLVLAVFNLLPGLPLDGGRLLRAVVWALGASPLTGTKVASWAGRIIAVLVAVSGLLIDRTQAGIAAGVMSIALAAYLWVGATQSLKTAEVLARLPAVRVPDLLRPGVLVPDDLSVAEALRRVWENNARGVVLVDSAQRPRAIVDEAMIGRVPPDRRPWTAVSAVARPLEPGLLIPVDIDAKGLLDRMQATPAHEYLAVDDAGRPAGIIATADFARTLRTARA